MYLPIFKPHSQSWQNLRMRFEIEAEDDSGSIDIILDDREARAVIMKNAYEINEEVHCI